MSEYKTGQYIYANTIYNGKYIKIKTEVIEIKEITEEEYNGNREVCRNEQRN